MAGIKISVIMLTYNRENLITRAIESVLIQSFRDFEYIIVNNGSTDSSGTIADDYSSKDARIRVIHRNRGSIGSGRNTGLDAAKGDYIAFIDDDDWCEPDFLKFLYNLAVENNADVSICGCADKTFDEKKVMTPEEALIKLMWRKHYTAAFPAKMFCRALADKLRFPEEGVYDDIALIHKLLALANRVVYHGLPKYTFYRHESNNSAWTTNHALITPKTLDEYLTTFKQRTNWLTERFPANSIDWRYFEWSFMISMIEKINRLTLPDCDVHLENMTNELMQNRSEFLAYKDIQDFEKKWMELYV